MILRWRLLATNHVKMIRGQVHPSRRKHATTPQWDAKYYSGTETENNDSSQSDSESCTSTSSGTDSDLGQDNVISRDDHSPKHRNIIHDTGD